MIILTLETEHFSFQAAGNDRDEAQRALDVAADYHAEQYGIVGGWQRQYDVQEIAIEPGECFRDGALLYRAA